MDRDLFTEPDVHNEADYWFRIFFIFPNGIWASGTTGEVRDLRMIDARTASFVIDPPTREQARPQTIRVIYAPPDGTCGGGGIDFTSLDPGIWSYDPPFRGKP